MQDLEAPNFFLGGDTLWQIMLLKAAYFHDFTNII